LAWAIISINGICITLKCEHNHGKDLPILKQAPQRVSRMQGFQKPSRCAT